MKPETNLKKNKTLWLYMTLIVMAVLLVMMIIVMGIAVLLMRYGVIDFKDNAFPVPLIFIVIIGAVIGTLFSLLIGKKIMKPIEKLIKSMQKVAQGDFSVRIDEHSKFAVIDDMFGNFNAMTKQLSGTETLRNDFVVNVSHEFKTPLTAIEGYATLLQGNPDKAKHDEYVELIINNVHRLSTLTGNVLQLSKLENQGIVTDKKEYCLDEQIRKSILLLEREWTAKNIEFDIDMPVVTFYGNEGLLYQVWYNLLSNAIKFSYEGGIIGVQILDADEEVIIKISDNGCGIDSEAQTHIFDKFYQENKAHSQEGNGLGLALVKQIVTLCCGTITVNSTPNKGTTFEVRLPNGIKI